MCHFTFYSTLRGDVFRFTLRSLSVSAAMAATQNKRYYCYYITSSPLVRSVLLPPCLLPPLLPSLPLPPSLPQLLQSSLILSLWSTVAHVVNVVVSPPSTSRTCIMLFSPIPYSMQTYYQRNAGQLSIDHGDICCIFRSC